MNKLKHLLIRLGISDAIFRGTALTANLIMMSIIATVPGFGKEGILVSAALQMTIGGLFEIPTGIFADKFGWNTSVRIGLWIKVLTTALFVIATAFALNGETHIAWLFIAFEGLADAFANSFLNGAYQAAYQKWFNSASEAIQIPEHEKSHPFLRSFQYGVGIRIGLPAIALLIGILLRNNSYPWALPASLLLLLFCLRFFVIRTVMRDIRNVVNVKPKPAAKTTTIDLFLGMITKDSDNVLFYGFTTFLTLSVGSYLLAQCYRMAMAVGFNQADSWIIGASLTFILQTISVFLGRYFYPKISQIIVTPKIIRGYFFSILVITGITLLIFTSENILVHLITLPTYSALILLLAQGGQRLMISHLANSKSSSHHATRFSIGEVIGLLFFGTLAGTIVLTDLTTSAIQIVLCAILLTSTILLATFWRPNKRAIANTQWPLKKYFNVSLTIAIALFAILGAIWETRSFTSKSLEIKKKSERIILTLYESSIRDPATQGSIVEVGNRSRRLMDEHKDICIDVEMSDEKIITCKSTNNSNNKHIDAITSGIYFDSNNKTPAATFTIYFDNSQIYETAKDRFLAMFFGFSLLGVLMAALLRLTIQRVFDELRLILNITDRDCAPQKFYIKEFAHLYSTLQKQIDSELEVERAEALNKLSRQVAHDIRSPLSALNMISATLDEVSEEKRLIIRNASRRINDIANNLLQNAKIPSLQQETITPQSLVEQEPCMALAIIDNVVSEKRVQYREQIEVEIHADLNNGYGLFINIQPTDLSRVISNLVNNSIESIKGPGVITIDIFEEDKYVTFRVSDSGKGIPPEVLLTIGARGISHGKSDKKNGSGSGLGLHHARETIESNGGKLHIESQVGKGTTITISLPRAKTPSWFVEKIILNSGSCLVSIDDDETIHQIWSKRLTSITTTQGMISHQIFTSLEKFEAWVKMGEHPPLHFFVDYEFLAQKGTGLDIIERTGIASRAFLATSRYEEPHVRKQAKILGVKIIPKGLAPIVPIEIRNAPEKFDAILIDDDPLVRTTWSTAAKINNKNIICFAKPDDFFDKSKLLDLSTPLYIDVNLSNEVRGEQVAKQAAELGFTNIALTTGYNPESVQCPACVSRIVSKEPDFSHE